MVIITTVITIVFAILVFGVLVAIHEFGHFIAAKTMGFQVNEFAVGMGPKIFKRQKGETLYSLRLLPIGGFCAMEGEDENSENPRAFGNRPIWARFIVLVAGSVMNFLLGLVILVVMFAIEPAIIPGMPNATATIDALAEGFPYESEEGLLPGDKILAINGNNIYVQNDISLFLGRGAGEPYDFKVERNGQKILIEDLPLEPQEYPDGQGGTSLRYGLNFASEPVTAVSVLKNSWLYAVDVIRIVRISIGDLFTQRAQPSELMGVVGIIDTMTQVTTASQTFGIAVLNFLNIAAMIAVNLAVMNLLPLPALDGGRIFFLLIELVRRKPVKAQYEGYVHLAGFALFMVLMVYVFYNDIVRLVERL